MGSGGGGRRGHEGRWLFIPFAFSCSHGLSNRTALFSSFSPSSLSFFFSCDFDSGFFSAKVVLLYSYNGTISLLLLLIVFAVLLLPPDKSATGTLLAFFLWGLGVGKGSKHL